MRRNSKCDSGCQGLEVGRGLGVGGLISSFTFTRWRVMRMDGGDCCTTMGMHLMPLSCTLNGKDGKFCYAHFSTKKILIKKINWTWSFIPGKKIVGVAASSYYLVISSWFIWFWEKNYKRAKTLLTLANPLQRGRSSKCWFPPHCICDTVHSYCISPLDVRKKVLAQKNKNHIIQTYPLTNFHEMCEERAKSW